MEHNNYRRIFEDEVNSKNIAYTGVYKPTIYELCFCHWFACFAIDLFVIFQLLVDEYNEGEKRRQAMVAKLDELRSRNKFVRGENAVIHTHIYL